MTSDDYLLSQSIFINRLWHEHGIRIDFEKILETGYARFLRPGGRIVEAGAHTGMHTRKLMELVGPSGTVHAFEPLPGAFEVLQRSFADTPSVVTSNIALGRESGTAPFVVTPGSIEESGLRVKTFYITPPEAYEIDVRVETLDGLGIDCDYIKLDMEGGELDCLRGAVGLIDRCQPIISVEYHQNSYSAYGHLREDLFDLAASQRYAVHDIFGNRIPSRDIWSRICDQTEFWDYYLCPLSRSDWFERMLQRNAIFKVKNFSPDPLRQW